MYLIIIKIIFDTNPSANLFLYFNAFYGRVPAANFLNGEHQTTEDLLQEFFICYLLSLSFPVIHNW